MTHAITTRRAELAQRLSEHRSKIALLLVIGTIAAITAFKSEVFLSWANFENILVQCSIIGILAMGTTLLMVSGGIDLSVGSGVSLAGVLLATLMADGWSPLIAVIAAIMTASAVGGATGFLAAKSSHHPFVLTLGVLTLLQGVTLLVSISPVTDIPESFISIIDWRPLGLPLVVFVFGVVVVVTHLTLTYTALGRWLYAIGSSESAARLSGIRIDAVKVVVYAISGVFVGIGGVLMTAQLASAQPEMGRGLELAAIAAVAVGGTPLAGGRGDVLGTLLGVLLLALIGNSLNLLSITSSWQFVLQGLVIVIAVLAQRKT
ncbi:hypothetical protein [Nocardioides sp.]|uniref:ABC transporter permease n=1 Tax=Nocardioides sp. TaxID=35761 RepID=UPI002628D68D|nr:hypothetical protein [Nocardioides sp.]MDI6911715.1 hypothetical protein [Nocardioides sp.]